jgi:cytochrome c peroxidase
MKASLFYLSAMCVASVAGGVEVDARDLDLTSLENYAAQEIPGYINRDNNPGDNQLTDIGATLGRVLFHDVRLSSDESVSCSSCHKQDRAFGDTAVASAGINGLTGRHSMRLVNYRFAEAVTGFWDQRASTLEEQATMPIRDHVEMGFSGTDGDPDFSVLLDRLEGISEYRVLFAAAFGDAQVTEERMQKALAQFVRSIQSFDSRYDTGRAMVNGDNQNFPNFTDSENDGKRLFLRPPVNGGAGCAGCHRPPEFDIDPASRNNGVITALDGGVDLTNTRSPSLRDLVSPDGDPHGGFMHNASLTTLESVVDHYDSIPAVNAALDPRLRDRNTPQQLNLSDTQKQNLVDFLSTLTGQNLYTDPKWSNPFDDDGTINLITYTGLRLEVVEDSAGGTPGSINLTATGIPDSAYLIESTSDFLIWDSTPVTATADGQIEAEISAPVESAAVFFRLVPLAAR